MLEPACRTRTPTRPSSYKYTRQCVARTWERRCVSPHLPEILTRDASVSGSHEKRPWKKPRGPGESRCPRKFRPPWPARPRGRGVLRPGHRLPRRGVHWSLDARIREPAAAYVEYPWIERISFYPRQPPPPPPPVFTQKLLMIRSGSARLLIFAAWSTLFCPLPPVVSAFGESVIQIVDRGRIQGRFPSNLPRFSGGGELEITLRLAQIEREKWTDRGYLYFLYRYCDIVQLDTFIMKIVILF